MLHDNARQRDRDRDRDGFVGKKAICVLIISTVGL